MKTYTYALINNGREIDNVDAGIYATEAEALEAGTDAMDDVCPSGSPRRRYYRVEVRSAALTAKAAKVLADMIRESSREALPADDHALLVACGHNICQGWYADAERAAGGDVAAIADLREAIGLPALS